jgi:hypothetical protein
MELKMILNELANLRVVPTAFSWRLQGNKIQKP